MSGQKVHGRKVLGFIFVAVLLMACTSARAAITATGSLLPDENLWLVPGDLLVGYQGPGELDITGGSLAIVQGNAVIGSSDADYTTATGTVQVTGPESTWLVQNEVFIGPLAQGYLILETSASMSSGDTIIGGMPLFTGEGDDEVLTGITVGVGSASVSGGSQWATGDLIVAAGGTGNFSVTTGGAVSSDLGVVGVAPDAEGEVVIDEGSWSLNDSLVVGMWGDGTMTIDEGGQVASAMGWVGGADPDVVDMNDPYLLANGNPSGTGTVDVNGPGSQWDAGAVLTVGAWGNGTLDIRDGAAAGAGEIFIGGISHEALGRAWDPNNVMDGTGTVRVSGEGSALYATGSESLYVGYSGTGSLDVNDGGYVESETIVVGGGPDATGTITVRDSGSELYAWEMVVGAWGQGDMTISNGADAAVGTLHIGGFDAIEAEVDPDMLEDLGEAQGVGSVTVTGEGSSLEVAEVFTLVVGSGGTGTLTVSDSAELDSMISYVGGYVKTGYDEVNAVDTVEFVGGTGTVEVTQDATWETGLLAVGAGGSGTLDVNDGGQMSSYVGVVGLGPDSTGAVTVSGSGSLWDNAPEYAEGTDGTLIVGAWGQGQLTVANGGDVNAVTLYIGGADLSALDIGVDFGLDDPNGAGTVTVTGDGSVLRVLPSEGGIPMTTYVGYGGQGTLNILDGGLVESDVAAVGLLVGGTGQVNVDGTGSTWSISGGGEWPGLNALGDGEVTISNGGLVDVNGVNAVLEVAGAISVGSEGAGTMSVSSTGSVHSGSGTIGGYDPQYEELADYFADEAELGSGSGEVTVAGSGSEWLVDNQLMVGFSGDGTLSITGEGYVGSATGIIGVAEGATGTVNVSGAWWDALDLVVGAWGTGELTILDAGGVYVWDAYIGGAPLNTLGFADDPNYTPTGTGTVTVTGVDSALIVEALASLHVGYSGAGTLDVNDGGYVYSQSAGIAALPGSMGSVTIDGIHVNDGDVPSQWDNDGSMFVGGYGTGSLTISNGGQVYSGEDIYIGGFDIDDFDIDVEAIGYDPNGTGSATVTGAGSYLESYGLAVGTTGTGTLHVLDGAQVYSGLGVIGFAPDSNGVATVDGEGSSWTLSDEDAFGDWSVLGVGVYGQGQLTISGGGQVTVADAVVGGFDLEDIGAPEYAELWGDPNGTGSILVTDANSSLDVLYGLSIGYTGTGTMRVEAGGQVNAEYGIIGDYPGGSGEVIVTGPESQWTLSDDLIVGYEGTGVLTISDGGTVVADEEINIGYDTTGDGTVLVTGEGSTLWAGSDLYVGGSEEGGWGTGSLFVTDGGQVNVFNELYVWETGTLGGDGTVNVTAPTTLYNYGTIAPGDDGIGTLTVNGNVVFEPNSVYSVEIAADTADKLEVNGDVTINGGIVQVDSRGTVIGEQDYQIILADSVTGEFDVLDTALLDFSISDPNLFYDPNSVWLHLVAASFNDPNLCLTYNQRQVAGALQEIGDEGGNEITDALQDVEDESGLRRAYDQLSGHKRPPLAPITIAGTSRFLGMVSSRMQSLQNGLVDAFDRSSLFAMAGPDAATGDGRTYDLERPGMSVGNGSRTLADSQWGLWGRGYGLYGDREDGTEVPGYSYSVYGGSAGLDYQFTETWLGGIVLGMSTGDVDFAGSRDNSDFEAMHVGLYASAAWERWYLDSVAMYAALEYETERYVDLLGERLTGDFDGTEMAAYVEVGRNWDLAPNLRLQPLASLQYTYLDLDSYEESGGVSALAFDGQTYESIKGSLGARLTQRLAETLRGFRADVQLRGRWVHEFGDNRSDVDAAFADTPTVVFNVRDDEVSSDSVVLGAGLSAMLNDRTKVYVDFDTRFNSDESVQVIGASLQYRW